MNKYFFAAVAAFVFFLSACNAPTEEASKAPPETPPSQAEACGTIQGLVCSTGEYCNFGVGRCNIADAEGVCEERPKACTREFRPVCGCDGKTYSNACEAASAGVSIDHEGACKEEPKVCGGIAGVACGEGQYCDLGAGNCQIADAQGVCKAKPEVCTQEFVPVCGCDGKTHSNACAAAAAGVSIDHPGECKSAAPTP